jgi:hypothetical protein
MRHGTTRAGFLAGTAGLIGGGALLGAPAAHAASPGDVAILNFALTLEELEAAFYAEAVTRNGLTGDVLAAAKELGDHEVQHVAALRQVLGSAAIAKPTFDFGGTTASQTAFLAAAVKLEDLGVRAYKGQAPLIEDTAILKSALAIHTVEARHAALMRRLAGNVPAPRAVDPPLSRTQVLAEVAKTGFLVPTG